MNKKIIAFTAALVMTASVFTACGNKNVDDNIETSIAVIVDGEEVTDQSSDGAANGDFVDPGLNFSGAGNNEDGNGGNGGNGDNSGGENVQTAPPEEVTEATLPPNQDEIVAMIEGAQTEAPQRAPIMKEYNVDYTTRYGYNQLNAQEKELYGKILEAVKSIRLKVDVDESVTDEMWIKVYGCMYMAEPQLFWLSSKRVTKGKLWYWEVDPDTIASMQKEIDAKVGQILAQAEGKSDYDKLKIFHDYIALNNDFVKEEGFNQTIYGGFVNGQIQCEGYAKTMQYLCDLSGIESMVIVGANESNDSHAWNVVKVDGKWYNLDTTWDDPILTNVDKTNIRYRYFLVPDEWIHNKSHFEINRKISGTQVTYFTPPACTSDDLNYFKVTNQLYSDKASADAALRAAMTKAADSKLRAAEIRVSSKKVYDEITADLSQYASWIKSEKSAVTSVTSNCDPNTLVIELDLIY